MSDIAAAAASKANPRAKKLPVLATVRRAYAAVFGNFGMAVRIAWLWSLLVVALQLLSTWVLPAWMTNPADIMHLDLNTLIFVSFAGFLNGLLILPALASIAVNWHRALLLGERPGAWAFMRLDGRVWAYVGIAAIIATVRFVASVPQVMLSLERGTGGELAIYRALAAIVFVGLLVIVPRLSLGLPGTAIGAPSAGLGSGYASGRGNTWRLAWGGLLCMLPVLAIGFATFTVWPGAEVMFGTGPLALAVRAGVTLTWPFTCILFAGFLSYAYAHLHGLSVPSTAQTATV